MDRESLERIRKMTKDKITVSNFQNSEFMKENNKKINLKKISIVACCILVLTTGVVFGKEIENFIKYYFGIDENINKAAEKGYVEDVNMNPIEEETILTHDNTGEIIDNIDVSVKIDEFLMDDINLSVNFTFKFDDKIKEVFDLDNLQYISLPDLIIFDEDNRILSSNCSKSDFEKICEQYNLDYNFEDYYLNNNPTSSYGINDHNKEENFVKYGVNFLASDKCFPNSKELNFVFTKIKLEKYEYNVENVENGEYLKSNSVTLTGDWKVNVEVPEKMYNHQKTEYKVASISNPNIAVSYASASETGFKFKAILSKVKTEVHLPFEEYKNELFEQKESGKITEEEYNKKMNELTSTKEYDTAYKKYMRENEIITTDYIFFADDEEKSIDKITHVTNSKGEKFKISTSSTAAVNFEEVYLKETDYEFIGTFEMTKYDATDKLTVILIYYGEPVYIELEKIK